jgi:hypothetical protein
MTYHRKCDITSRQLRAARGAAFVAVAVGASAWMTVPAHAAGIGPEIAYSTWGTRPAVYVVNPDGSGRRLLYTGARNTRIGSVDMKPGGGEVSFYETTGNTLNAPGELKTVQYAATGRAGTVSRSVPGCRYSVDYHPSDGSLLIVSCDRQLQRLAASGWSPTNVAVSAQVSRARWLSGGTEFIYSAGGKLWRTAFATPETAEEVMVSNHDFFATAHTSSLTLGTTSTRIDLIDVDGKSVTTGIETGECPHFSPNDSTFVYMANFGKQLMIRPTSGGQSTPISVKANFSSVDWRN